MRKPIPQRIHARNYPRLLIWGVIGSLFCAAMLLLGFPKDTAIAVILVSIGMGVLTSFISHLKLLKRFQI